MKIGKGQVKSPSRPSPRPSTSVAGRFFSRRSIRLDGKQVVVIDISVRGAAILGSSHSPFRDILPYLRTFSRHFWALSGDVRNYLIVRAVPSCSPLFRAAISCRASKENRPAHRLGWTRRSRRERWSAVPNSHRASGGRLLERGVLKQKRCY